MSSNGREGINYDLTDIDKLCFKCNLPQKDCGEKWSSCAYTKALSKQKKAKIKTGVKLQ